MVVLEAFGLATSELFGYNRETFQFDNEQRIDRDIQRVKMQIERFNLFREDIEDLVKLTVQKMDMYHLVAALVLGCTTTIFTEGRIHAHTPPFFINIYMMTIGGGWLYILMTVWLSMYASVASHSFGTRLRTRYVRLPIPNLQQLYGLTSKLSDFEKQGMKKMLRVPFGLQGTPDWQRTAAMESTSSASASSPAADLLGQGEAAFGKAEVLTNAAAATGEHVQIFRALQAKWQCFDAYARASLALGVHQILQALNFFVLGLTLIENETRTTAFAVTLIFQGLCLAVLFLDVAGMTGLGIFVMQAIGSVPVFLTLFELSFAKRDATHHLFSKDPYPYSPIGCFFQSLWFQLILMLARPSGDMEAALPRRFRSVLFLDVFGDATYDPTDAENKVTVSSMGVEDGTARFSRAEQETLAAAAERASSTAQAALRRWEATPEDYLSSEQSEQIWNLRKEYTISRKMLMNYLYQQKAKRGQPFDIASRDEEDLRNWYDLSSVEHDEDEFYETILGPFESKTLNARKGTFYYDLEADKVIREKSRKHALLSMKEVAAHVNLCTLSVQKLLAQIDEATDETQPGHEDGSTNNEMPVKKPLQKGLTGLLGQSKPTVDRLPWKCLRRLTQALQFCWMYLAVMQALANWLPDRFGPDFFLRQGQNQGLSVAGEHAAASEQGKEDVAWVKHQGTTHKNRRLQLRTVAVPSEESISEPWWQRFEEVDASWPHGVFFKASELSCLPSSNGRKILITSPYLLYESQSSLTTSRLGAFRALPRKSFAPGAVTFCGLRGSHLDPDSRCLLAALSQNGSQVSVWPFARSNSSEGRFNAVKLPIRGTRPWRRMGGAAVPCSIAYQLARATSKNEKSTNCLIVFGWDGAEISVSAVPLNGREQNMPSANEAIVARFSMVGRHTASHRMSKSTSGASCAATSRLGGRDASELHSLHFEPHFRRLWALSVQNELIAWDLTSGKVISHWNPRYGNYDGRAFQPVGLCEAIQSDKEGTGMEAARELLIIGSTQGGTKLLRVLLPDELRSTDA